MSCRCLKVGHVEEKFRLDMRSGSHDATRTRFLAHRFGDFTRSVKVRASHPNFRDCLSIAESDCVTSIQSRRSGCFQVVGCTIYAHGGVSRTRLCTGSGGHRSCRDSDIITLELARGVRIQPHTESLLSWKSLYGIHAKPRAPRVWQRHDSRQGPGLHLPQLTRSPFDALCIPVEFMKHQLRALPSRR